MKHLIVFLFLLCLVPSFASATSTQHGYATIIESETGVPPGGFLLNKTLTTTNSNGPESFKCAAGPWGPTFPTNNTGWKCLLQYNIEDTSFARGVFGIVHNIPGDSGGGSPGQSIPFPDFNIWNTGTVTTNQLLIIQNSGGWWTSGGFQGSGPNAFVFGGNPYSASPLIVTTDVPRSAFAGATYGIATVFGCHRGNICTAGDTDAPDLLTLFGNASCCEITGTKVFTVEDNGHLHVGGAGLTGTLAVSTCGTSPSIAGSDSAFTITLGTGTPSACTVTFKKAWTSADITCTFISETDGVMWRFAQVGGAGAWTGVTLTSSAALTNGSRVHGVCVGHLT